MPFIRPEALLSTKLIDAAYWLHTDADEAVAAARRLGFPTVLPISVGSLQALVCSNVDTVVVAIAGSANLADWIANFRFLPVGLEGDADPRRVHRGFRKSVALAFDAIMAAVKEVHAPHRKRLVIAGHSKGGGEAVLLAFAMSKMPEFAANVVYLLGCPGVGNRRFAREYDYILGGVTWRIVNNNDAVTRLGHRHVGRQVYFDWRGRMIEEAGFWRRLWNQLIGRYVAWKQGVKIDGAMDHLMPAYLGVLAC